MQTGGNLPVSCGAQQSQWAGPGRDRGGEMSRGGWGGWLGEHGVQGVGGMRGAREQRWSLCDTRLCFLGRTLGTGVVLALLGAKA